MNHIPEHRDTADSTHREIETANGFEPVDQLCPECLTKFDYRLDATINPVFDGEPPVELCIHAGGGSGTIEAIFVHEHPEWM